MTHKTEIAQASDPRHKDSVSPTEALFDVPPPASDAPARVDETGVELKRGAFLNTIAMVASNFRGIFSFLVARLLGPAALGIFSVAWSTTDIISKIGVLGSTMRSLPSSRGRKLSAIGREVAYFFESLWCLESSSRL